MKFWQFNPLAWIGIFIVYVFVAEEFTSYLIGNSPLFVSIPATLVIIWYQIYIVVVGFNHIKVDGDKVVVMNFFKKYRLSIGDVKMMEDNDKFVVEIKNGKKFNYRKGPIGIFTKGGNAVERFRKVFKNG